MNKTWTCAYLGGLFLLLGTMACGGDPTGGNPTPTPNPIPIPNPTPTDHVLAQTQPATFGAGNFFGFEFIVPSTAQVHFSASENTTDTWNVAIFTPAEWVSYQNGSGNQPYADPHNNVSSVDDSASLPAGDWFLGFHCDNQIERRMLVFSLDALY